MRFPFSFAVTLAAATFLSSSFAQAQKTDRPAQGKAQAASDKTQPAKKGGPGFPGLIPALKKSPGCLGVELARTQGGKNLIFAWFKDKKAALAWYHSDFPQAIVGGFIGKGSDRKPLADVADDVGPIMAIASITFSDKPKLKGVKLPISQIAIELYAPLKGGLSLGGTFAPAALKKAK